MTTLTYLLLGLLTRSPLSGYDLNKAFQATVQHFWTADQSQIYRALYKMTADGWVQVEVVHQTDNPDKKVYQLTEAGRAALLGWLKTPLEDEPPREAWLGQLFFSDHLSREEVIGLLEQYVAQLSEQIIVFEHLDTALRGELSLNTLPTAQLFRLVTLDYGLARHRFELEWVHSLIDQVKGRRE